MKKRRLLPFSMLPASWGLAGKTRARAEAEYYYEGEDLDKALAALEVDSEQDKELAELEIDLKYGNIGQAEFDKKVAEIKQEPYVNVLKMGINPETAQAGYIELDWNDHFVKFLHENGYTGTSDEDVVNKWFNDVCKTILVQENADMDFGLQPGVSEDVIRTTTRTESKGKTSKTSKGNRTSSKKPTK